MTIEVPVTFNEMSNIERNWPNEEETVLANHTQTVLYRIRHGNWQSNTEWENALICPIQ